MVIRVWWPRRETVCPKSHQTWISLVCHPGDERLDTTTALVDLFQFVDLITTFNEKYAEEAIHQKARKPTLFKSLNDNICGTAFQEIYTHVSHLPNTAWEEHMEGFMSWCHMERWAGFRFWLVEQLGESHPCCTLAPCNSMDEYPPTEKESESKWVCGRDRERIHGATLTVIAWLTALFPSCCPPPPLCLNQAIAIALSHLRQSVLSNIQNPEKA